MLLSAPTLGTAQAYPYDFPDESPSRVLFVGNSYLYYNDSLHNHVKRIVAEFNNEPLEYKSATIGGARLSHHDLTSHLDYQKLGISAPFEWVVLQGGSSETLSPANLVNFEREVRKKTKQARERGTAIALYMTHAYVAPHKRTAPGMQDVIQAGYENVAQTLKIPVIPVGVAFARAYEERPDIALHKAFDGTHPNLLGTFLAANVVVASIYQYDVSTSDYNYFDVIPDKEATYLRSIAQEVVNQYYGRNQ